jgi:hypothetical protein
MRFLRLPAVILLALCSTQLSLARDEKPAGQQPVLWVDPGDIGSRNLLWCAGGEDHRPALPVEFLSEAKEGTSPKFEVRDRDGKKWTAKMGLEARPETVASRLLWAVGFSANYNYFLPELEVTNMPAKLHRGRKQAGHDGHVPHVRMQTHPAHMKRVGDWNWRHNPFYGTREFNGLRVMMGLLGNWDLKDENNAILENEETGARVYEVSDVGATMGTPGKSYTDKSSKGNLSAYRHARLIAHVHSDHIDLNFPKRPPLAELFPEFEWAVFFHQLSLRWVGKHIPRQDAKWIGSLLAQLTPQQINDAFRAAGYSPEQIEAYSRAVQSRIEELKRL